MLKFILIFFVTFLCFGQNKIQVLNKLTSEPISYANVWIENKIFTTTDSLGYFKNIKSSNLKYKISAIGYNNEFSEPNDSIIFLMPKDIILDEVKIINQKFLNKVKYGKAKKDIFIGVNFDVTASEFIKFIPNTLETTTTLFINSISFYTNSTSNNRKINIVLYSIGKNGSPDEIINDENIIHNLKKGKTINYVNLKKLKIILPKKGLYVGIQHLLIEDNKYYPTINNPNHKSFCYEPFLSVSEIKDNFDSWDLFNGEWKINEKFSLNIEVEISD